MRYWRAGISVAVLACGVTVAGPGLGDSKPAAKGNATAPVDTKKVCKAAIAAIMYRDVSIVAVGRQEPDGVVHLSYLRPDDRSKWSYRCKLDGSKVNWGMENGRWRDTQIDEKVTFSAGQDGSVTIDIVYSDGSKATKRYGASKL